jgi:type VI secretion system protein ImpC
MGQMLGAPIVGGADSHLVGCPSFSAAPDPADWIVDNPTADNQAWSVLRTLPEAAWIGLGLPRFIIRLPYGEDTDPVDAFRFEEMRDPVDHEDYLWANPVYALVLVFGRTFTQNCWDFSEGILRDVDGLPIHLFKDGGETAIKPCAEALLSQRAVEKVARRGLMTLISFKDRGRIQLFRFQSIAEPPCQLAGRWHR